MARTLLASTMLAGPASGQAQTLANTGQLGEIVVTAQKRPETLQQVPISVQALSESQLGQMNVQGFDDYAKLLPSLSYQDFGIGQTSITMRGITSGSIFANHSGPQPTVGVYLDDVPTTTKLGQIDVHIYDVDRIEALAGPQGTLYGASSESGTLKIVTNKPDPSKFSAGYNLDINDTDHGGVGNIVEGFVNEPIANNAAIRLVAYQEHDSGFIDNVYGPRTYPSTGFTVNNAGQAKNDYNSVDTYGARAALKIDLDENWTVLPSVMAQDQVIAGIDAYDTSVGFLQDRHFLPEKDHDRWVLPALTVTGKVGNFDLTYAASYFVHDLVLQADYSDYSYFYDVLYGLGKYETGPNGKPINIGQSILEQSHYTKITQEVRIATPAENRLRLLAGLFYERQEDDHLQDYTVGGLDPHLSVTGWPSSWYLIKWHRIDRDYAAFANGSFDITPALTIDAGLRVYRYDNSLEGFDGAGPTNPYFTGAPSQLLCTSKTPIFGAPCQDVSGEVAANGVTYRTSLTYRIDAARMVYVTASDGYRPGGANLGPNLPAYHGDTLINYEVGWKTSWFGDRLRWNGDVFYDPWRNFQYSYLGTNSFPDYVNAGNALSEGIETDFAWQILPRLTLSGAGSVIDSRLTTPYCGKLDATGNPITNCAVPQAPKGAQLPASPILKDYLTVRQGFEISPDIEGYFQASELFTGGSWPEFRTDVGGIDRKAAIGRIPSYFQTDLAGGAKWGNADLSLYMKNALNSHGQLYRYDECPLCYREVYAVPIHPLMIGLRFGQKF